ncbi:MAG: polysaccharide biosynthesis protein phosphatase [Mucilaginibacter sp.]|nr:polysaccharide biosynthesis protein phosphatase [Mucilaginibacter sp.]
MFNFFKKKEEKKAIKFNYESIVVDMHSHVLPGIDDGAQNPEESIVLIKKMMALGIKKIIATPHIMLDFYRNTPETINGALEVLKAELQKQNIDIKIEAAAEHYFDETFEKRVEDGRLMTMGDNYVLFEYSFINPPPNAFEVIQKMIEWGNYKPILAHPERYNYMSIEQMANLRAWGCNMQMNTISLTGYYGKDVKRKAESMVDNNIVDFISSDMHHPRHAAAFQDALTTPYLEKLLFDYPLKNVMLK